MYCVCTMPSLAGCGDVVDRPRQTSGILRRGERQCPGRIASVVAEGMQCRDPAGFRTSTKRPPAALGTCIRAQTACCAACHGSIPLDNGPVCGLASYIAGPRAHAARRGMGAPPASTNTAIRERDGDNLLNLDSGPHGNLRRRAPHPMGPRVSRPAVRGLPISAARPPRPLTFYPGLVKTAPGNPFNNRQWLTRRPSTRHGDRPALGRSPMDKTPRRCG